MSVARSPGLVERYLVLGLAVGRHIDGFVDSYYGPARLSERVGGEPVRSPEQLIAEARSLLAGIEAGEPLGDPGHPDSAFSAAPDPGAGGSAARRHFLASQTRGVLTTARKLAGEQIAYADEIEQCYGVRPHRVDEQRFEEAHRRLDEAVPGSGPLAERFVAWKESQTVDIAVLEKAIQSLAEDLRARTSSMFGLPDGERVEFELVSNQPWSGFNYYLGGLASKVAINVDLPVPSASLALLVAHEAYPGHHTEASRKEAGLVRRRHYFEESIALVGTPHCLLAEGLADLGLEIVMGRRPERAIAAHLRPLKVPYDPDVVAVVAEASEALAEVRGNAAFRLHEDRADPETVVEEIERFALVSRKRAQKAVEFLLDPTWRAYVFCYLEGLPLCRRFVGSDPARFARLVTEQLTPGDLTVDVATGAG